MSDIPSELFREILVWLPAESVFRFRSVCKTWLSIIDDRSFIKAHANNQVYSQTLLVRNETGAPLYSFSLNSLKFVKGPQMIEATRIKQLIRPGVPRLPDFRIFQVPICNGLVLLSHTYIKKIWAIWNPLNGEYQELPEPNASLNKDRFGLGFGYDCTADDYKVVRIDRLSSAEKVVYQTLVYSMKSGLWSMIEGCPRHRLLINPGAFLNGTLYWRSSNSIVALNLRTENYWELPAPQEVVRSYRGWDDKYTGCLNALDGCLIFSLNYYDMYLFDGWVLKDNGVETSWIKLFSISRSLFRVEKFNLVAYLKSKRQVVLQHQGGFLWFDVDNNSVLKFSIHGFPGINSSQICSGSLVRLNARGSTIGFVDVTTTKTSIKKRKRKSKEIDKRLKICVSDVGDECCSDNNFCSEDVLAL